MMTRIERIDKAVVAMLCMQRQCWEHAVGGRALIHAGKRELAILFANDSALRQRSDGRPGIVEECTASTDAIAHAPLLIYAANETGSPQLIAAVEKLKTYMVRDAPRDAEGIIYHMINLQQYWADCTYMTPPAFSALGDYGEAIKQMRGARQKLWNSEKKMMFHIYDNAQKKWIRQEFWGGGNGWTAAGLSEIIGSLPEAMSDEKEEMILFLKEILEGCIAYRRADGLFHDVLDKPETFIESNLSQMLAFAIYHSVAGGWLESRWLEEAHIMRRAAIGKIDGYGVIHDACGSPFFDRPGTSTEAQAFTIMMESAAAPFVSDSI
jgi:unsaturated rhamnogalacturonyl hydrolase